MKCGDCKHFSGACKCMSKEYRYSALNIYLEKSGRLTPDDVDFLLDELNDYGELGYKIHSILECQATNEKYFLLEKAVFKKEAKE